MHVPASVSRPLRQLPTGKVTASCPSLPELQGLTHAFIGPQCAVEESQEQGRLTVGSSVPWKSGLAFTTPSTTRKIIVVVLNSILIVVVLLRLGVSR